MNGPEPLVLLARILRQGPQAPDAGDGLALPVYSYEAVESVGPVTAGDRLAVAHRHADVDDPGFAPGQLRRLSLVSEAPKHATLLYAHDEARGSGPVWYCAESEAVSER
jgi:hypothetical protein